MYHSGTCDPVETAMTEQITKTDTPAEKPGMSRRQALARLGLGAMAAYTAPTVLHLDQTQANIPSGGCNRFGEPSGPACG